MKISKLFHWLYAMLMLLPFVALAFNFVRISFSAELTFTPLGEVMNMIWNPNYVSGGVGSVVYSVYSYMFYNVFQFANSTYINIVCGLFTWWTIISIGYLIFDIIMYVPLLVHRWIDKAVIE